MYLIKQLKKNFTFLLCNYVESNFDIGGGIESVGKIEKSEKLPSLEKQKEEIIKILEEKKLVSLDDNKVLTNKILEGLKPNTKRSLDEKQINIIYRSLKQLTKVEGDILTPDIIASIEKEVSFEKDDKRKEKLIRQKKKAKIALHQEHLESVLEAEDMMCKVLGQCDGVEEAREAVKTNSQEERDKLMKELGDNLSKILLEKQERYKDNLEVLEEIKKLEIELGDAIAGYLKEVDNNDISDEQKDIILEMFKKKIGLLEDKLKIIESKTEKQRRYEGVKGEYEKVKQITEFKDIIGEKSFEELTAGDFYAMLKTNPEKVRNLLLATSDGSTVNISGNWEAYKNKKLKVNFGQNKGLDKIIGAGDILDIYNVKKVKINGVEGTRKANPRPGYYTESGRYLAIHDAYNIEITDTTKLEGEEIKEFESSINKRFDEIRGNEIKGTLAEVIKNKVESDSKAQEVQIPYKSKVDRDYIARFIDKPENKYLGLEISKDGVLKVKEGFNIGHLAEALNGYSETRAKITKYLSENKDSSGKTNLELSLKDVFGNNQEFGINALKAIIANKDISIKVEGDKIVIDSSKANLKIGDLFSTGYEYHGNRHRHEKYRSEIAAAAQKYGVPEGAIIQLIYHENGTWNPRIKAPGSSAYGLGQMINSTWNRFGRGLDRNDPGDQLMATANYMSHIRDTKNCSWQEVLAYYNTGLGIKGVKNINKYYNLNPAIARKQPSSEPRTNNNYFIAAVSYYNDISFAEAKQGITSGAFVNKKGNNYSVSSENYSKSKETKEIDGKPSLILHFTKGKVDSQLKSLDYSKIKNTNSVFIFRNGGNLSSVEMAKISNKLKDINPNLNIFIDQEGGKIARFEDFDNNINLRNKYLQDTILNSGISEGNKNKIASILNNLVSSKGYPSLEALGNKYSSIPESLKNDYLKAVTYLRLKTLKDRGVNTYGLVADLNEGNPVISGNDRSFSKSLESYKEFGKAMIDNANRLGMSVYLKHFPGHGAGNVDSHKDVLNYSSKNNDYLRKNISLFKELVDYGKGNVGLMVGHMLVPDEFKNDFQSVISKAKYVLTDDLGMNGYKMIKNGSMKIPNGKFFTTDLLGSNTIKVDISDKGGIA